MKFTHRRIKTSDFIRALFLRYLLPQDILVDQADIIAVEKAIELLQKLKDEAKRQGVLSY